MVRPPSFSPFIPPAGDLVVGAFQLAEFAKTFWAGVCLDGILSGFSSSGLALVEQFALASNFFGGLPGSAVTPTA